MEKEGRKNIWLLSWTSLLNDMSSEMVLPILPMFLQQLGASGMVISLVGGLRDGLGNILKMFFGYLSDRWGRRKVFIVSGYMFSSVCKLFLSLSKGWVFASVFALLERIGKGMRNAPRDALIAESSPKVEGIGFGIHRMMDTIGAILGSVIVLLLYWMFKLKFSSLILIASGLGFLTIIPLVWVREFNSKDSRLLKNVSSGGIGFNFWHLPLKMRLFILVAGIFSLGELSYMLFISRAGYMSFGSYRVIVPLLFYIFFNIFYAAFSVPFGMLFDKIGGRKTILLGYVLMTVTLVGFMFFEPIWGFVLFALYGVTKASLQGNQTAYVGRMASDGLKATAIGTFQTVTGVSMIIGSVIAGFIWDKFGLKWVFLYAAVMTTLAVLLLLFLWPKFDEGSASVSYSSIWINKKLR